MWLSNALESMVYAHLLVGPWALMKPPQVLILEQRPALCSWTNVTLLPSDKEY